MPGPPSKSPRILIVDDSATARNAMQSRLKDVTSASSIEIAVDGRHALQTASRAALSSRPFDIVLLDIEMPMMDGMSALDALIKLKPAPMVIMSSSQSRRGAAVTMEAMARGACDYVCKPTSMDGLLAQGFRRELIEKVRLWAGMAADQPRQAAPPINCSREPKLDVGKGDHEPLPRKEIKPMTPRYLPPVSEIKPRQVPVSTRPVKPLPKLPTAPTRMPRATVVTPSHCLGSCRALAIGCSTGGPQALLSILANFERPPTFPIFITQHMPPTFTTVLAEQIGRASGLECHEAENDLEVTAGRIYLARGDRHMLVERSAGRLVVTINDGAPENFCRPSVDPMLRSLLPIFGKDLVVFVLTGMGQDGLAGCEAARTVGAPIYAQDAETSVVWGMPGAVVRAGLASRVMGLGEFRSIVERLGEYSGRAVHHAS